MKVSVWEEDGEERERYSLSGCRISYVSLNQILLHLTASISVSLLCLDDCEQSRTVLHSEYEVYGASKLVITDTSRTWLLSPGFDRNSFLWCIHTRILLLIYEA